MTVFAYYRVSSVGQDIEVQKSGVKKYAEQHGLVIEKAVSDNGVSGTKDPFERKLGRLIDYVKKGDIILTAEISRLSRDTFTVLDIIRRLIKKGVAVHLIKQKLIADNSPMGIIFLTVWGAAAQMERELLVERTKEGIALARAKGKRIGRPKCSGAVYILENKEQVFERIREIGRIQVAKEYGVSYATLTRTLELDRK